MGVLTRMLHGLGRDTHGIEKLNGILVSYEKWPRGNSCAVEIWLGLQNMLHLRRAKVYKSVGTLIRRDISCSRHGSCVHLSTIFFSKC
jgi:hypothetical protein